MNTSANRHFPTCPRLVLAAVCAVIATGCAAGDVAVPASPPSIPGIYDVTVFHGHSVPYTADGIELTSQRLTFAAGGAWTGTRVTTYPTHVDTMFWTGTYTANGLDLVYSAVTIQSGGANGPVTMATANSASARVSATGMVTRDAVGDTVVYSRR